MAPAAVLSGAAGVLSGAVVVVVSAGVVSGGVVGCCGASVVGCGGAVVWSAPVPIDIIITFPISTVSPAAIDCEKTPRNASTFGL